MWIEEVTTKSGATRYRLQNLAKTVGTPYGLEELKYIDRVNFIK